MTIGTQDGAKLADLLEDCWKLTFDGPIVRVENTALRKRIDEQLAALRHPPAAEKLTGGGGGAGTDTTKVSDEYYPPAAVAQGDLGPDTATDGGMVLVAQGTREEPVAWTTEACIEISRRTGDSLVTTRLPVGAYNLPLYAAPPRGTREQEGDSHEIT